MCFAPYHSDVYLGIELLDYIWTAVAGYMLVYDAEINRERSRYSSIIRLRPIVVSKDYITMSSIRT